MQCNAIRKNNSYVATDGIRTYVPNLNILTQTFKGADTS